MVVSSSTRSRLLSVTESALRSRLIQAVSHMANSSYYRERAEQALRIARDNFDPELVKSLKAFAAEYFKIAEAIEAKALGEEPEDE